MKHFEGEIFVMETEIHVLIRYKVLDGKPSLRSLSVDEFFDLDSGEVPACDSAPRHLEMATYLGLTAKDLNWLRVEIVDSGRGESRTLEERYWEQGTCRASHLLETAGDQRSWETVVQITDPKSGSVHVLRLGAPDSLHPAGVRDHSLFWDEGEAWKNLAGPLRSPSRDRQYDIEPFSRPLP